MLYALTGIRCTSTDIKAVVRIAVSSTAVSKKRAVDNRAFIIWPIFIKNRTDDPSVAIRMKSIVNRLEPATDCITFVHRAATRGFISIGIKNAFRYKTVARGSAAVLFNFFFLILFIQNHTPWSRTPLADSESLDYAVAVLFIDRRKEEYATSGSGSILIFSTVCTRNERFVARTACTEHYAALHLDAVDRCSLSVNGTAFFIVALRRPDGIARNDALIAHHRMESLAGTGNCAARINRCLVGNDRRCAVPRIVSVVGIDIIVRSVCHIHGNCRNNNGKGFADQACV